MDDLLAAFITNSFSPEMQTEIYQTFSLCEKFDYNDLYSEFIDIVTDDTSGSNNEIMSGRFVIEINKCLDFVLNEHKIKLIPETSIQDKNQLLSALLLITDLEDYTPVIVTLESMEEPYTKLADVLSEYCTLDITYILTILEFFDIRILDKLKEFIYQKEAEKHKVESRDTEVINLIKAAVPVLGDQNFALALLNAGFRESEHLDIYLEYTISDLRELNETDLAINFLSLIYISKDGIKDPIEVYRNYSSSVIKDLNKTSRIEVLIMDLIKRVQEVIQITKQREKQAND